MIYCRITTSEEVNELWPVVRPFLMSALQYERPGYTPAQLKEFMTSGEFRLLVVEDAGKVVAAGALRVVDHPLFRECIFQLFGGNGLVNFIHLLRDVEEWALEQGCDSFRIVGRKGWARALTGWHEVGVVLNKRLA